MATTLQTLAEFLKLNDRNLDEIDVSNVINMANFVVNYLPFKEASQSTSHKYNQITSNPSAGFRAENAGLARTASARTTITDVLKILDFTTYSDQAMADAHKDGAEAYILAEALLALDTALFEYEKQIFQGTGNDAAGFNGLPDQSHLDGIADAQVYDAEGTTANTGSDIFMLRVGVNDIHGVLGKDGVFDVKPSVQTNMVVSGNDMPAYMTAGLGYAGLQIGSTYSAVRIVNVTEDSGKGCTDDLLGEALSLFPIGKGPTHIVMSKRSLKQLKASRTATNETGRTAPTPVDHDNIPIVPVESIADDNAILS